MSFSPLLHSNVRMRQIQSYKNINIDQWANILIPILPINASFLLICVNMLFWFGNWPFGHKVEEGSPKRPKNASPATLTPSLGRWVCRRWRDLSWGGGDLHPLLLPASRVPLGKCSYNPSLCVCVCVGAKHMTALECSVFHQRCARPLKILSVSDLRLFLRWFLEEAKTKRVFILYEWWRTMMQQTHDGAEHLKSNKHGSKLPQGSEASSYTTVAGVHVVAEVLCLPFLSTWNFSKFGRNVYLLNEFLVITQEFSC